MIIDIDDPLYDYSDVLWLKVAEEIIEDYDDEDLLEEVNIIPRIIGYDIAYIQALNDEVIKREILIEPEPIKLKDRTDDWLAERRNELKLEISKLKRQDEELKAERDDIDSEFMARFTARGTSGTRTARFTISARVDAAYPEVEDRNEFEAYLLKTGKLHLLQKRLSLGSVKEEQDIMKQEKEAWTTYLDDNKWSTESCEHVLEELYEMQADVEDEEEYEAFQEEYKMRIGTLANASNEVIKQATKTLLDDQYSIPGVGVAEKLTINQVKR